MTITSGGPGATVPPRPVPGPAISAEERIALLRQPPPRFSRRGLLLLAAAASLLGGGGVAAEVALSARGINGPPSATPADSHRAVQASQAPTLPAFLGLSALGGKPAPAFRLLDGAGKVISLGQLRGRAVVVSFFDASCTSLCPVVAGEMRRLAADLGPEASRVELLSVNTSPIDTSPADARKAATASGLGTLANWQFLTAPLASLDPVWSAYGVTVELQKSTGMLSYTGTGYLISPSGRLEYSFTPFGDERTVRLRAGPLREGDAGVSTGGDPAGGTLEALPVPRRRRTLAELRQPPPGFSWPGRPAAEAYSGPRWRRPRWIITGAVAIVVALTVLTDLPARTTAASQLSGARGTVAAIRSDAASCAYSLGEAERLAQLDDKSALSTSQVHVLDGLLSGDYNACALTNNDLYNLVNIETSSSPVGRQLGALRDGTYEWANPYAFAVIGDLAAIVASGRSAARAHRLAVDAAKANRQLESIEAGLRRLKKAVGGNLPSLGLVTAITSLPARH